MLNKNINSLDQFVKKDLSWDDYCTKKISIEFILSLGAACRTVHNLRSNKLRYFSSPFDWMSNYSLKTIEDIINNGIDDYFKIFEVIGAHQAIGTHRVQDKITGMISIHSFKFDKSIDDQYDIFISTMKRRFDRLINIFCQSKLLCFISNRNNQGS